MRLRTDILGVPVWHDCRGGFSEMVRRAIADGPIIAAHGPIYEEDPADQLLVPFRRTARETDWQDLDESSLVPESILGRMQKLRDEASSRIAGSMGFDHGVADLIDWARAGLVLEIARRAGISVSGRGVLRPEWRLKGTVTGRFGCEPVRGEDGGKRWSFNPLSLGPDDRWRVHPSDAVRHIAVLDFKAMDLCSMLSLVPGMSERYRDAPDPHLRTAEIITGGMGDPSLSLWPIRDAVKREIFVHAYGGESAIKEELSHYLPELDYLRDMPSGEAGRLVQSRSALAFRAALSRVLPHIVRELHHYLPMFTVHDELVLDCSEVGIDRIGEVVSLLEAGASDRLGVPYRVGVSTGYTYEDAKNQ